MNPNSLRHWTLSDAVEGAKTTLAGLLGLGLGVLMWSAWSLLFGPAKAVLGASWQSDRWWVFDALMVWWVFGALMVLFCLVGFGFEHSNRELDELRERVNRLEGRRYVNRLEGRRHDTELELDALDDFPSEK